LSGEGKDSYHLERFVEAQAEVWAQVREELTTGQKRSHWMWFMFPQIQGLGSSPTAQRFALSGMEEACVYLNHAVLGVRLRECTALVNAIAGRDVSEIFGYPDDLKFHSSMTLFERAALAVPPAEANAVFAQALSKYFAGEPDRRTLERL
jgi:uncharacterized protein (DUF1810 family)